MNKNKLKRTERGWAGHFCAANLCRFRRNTLLEYVDTKIIISSVGLYERVPNEGNFMTLNTSDAYFETMVFYAGFDGRYWDADVGKQIYFDSLCYIKEIDADDKANDMHEKVVREISDKLRNGSITN